VAFRPTGWSKSTSISHNSSHTITIISVPYSEHSSFNELRTFINDVRLRNQGDAVEFIPTVKTSNQNFETLLAT